MQIVIIACFRGNLLGMYFMYYLQHEWPCCIYQKDNILPLSVQL